MTSPIGTKEASVVPMGLIVSAIPSTGDESPAWYLSSLTGLQQGRSPLAPLARVEHITQDVAEEIQCEQRHRHRHRRENQQPPVAVDGIDHLRPVGEQQSPAYLRFLEAEAEETQERFIEDHRGDGESEI